MRRTLLALTLAYATVVLAGCGGGSSANIVSVREDHFSPRVLTINSGESVEWRNLDSRPHKIVSGTLDRVSNPQVLPAISIDPGTTFTPDSLEADFGDTVRWRNDRSAQFTLEILDDSGAVVTTRTLEVGEVFSFADFPAAGRYTFRQQNSRVFTGTVTLFGVPNANGLFESRTLSLGDRFTRPFNTTGTFTYFDLNEQQPSRSFITGTVVVQ